MGYTYSQHKDLIINKQQQKTNGKFVYFYNTNSNNNSNIKKIDTETCDDILNE